MATPVEHIVELRGSSCHGKLVEPYVAGAMLSRIEPLVRGAITMSVFRASRKRGRPMEGLNTACQIFYSGQSAGKGNSTRLHFTANRLLDSAPQLFAQQSLFEEIAQPEETGFDLVRRMIDDVAGQVTRSERFDTDLLKQVAGFQTVLKKGVESIELSGSRKESANETKITTEVIAAATQLRQATPPPRRVKIAGAFDMIRVSDKVFELLLPDGQRVRAVWAKDEVIGLGKFLSRDVVIEGVAVYRPSGTLLRVDTTAIAPATNHDRNLFAQLPLPSAPASIAAKQKPQTSTTGINAIWGIWPGEESDEELLDSVEEVG